MTKRKRSSKISPESLMENYNPEVRAIVSTLRRLIREVVPNTAEKANPGWRSISYRHPQQGYFCGIFPEQERVVLVFEYGVLLPDPDYILEGDGKQVRNVILTSAGAIPVESIKKAIVESLALPTKKAEKLALIRSGATRDSIGQK